MYFVTTSLTDWSVCLITNHEVAVSIPGTPTLKISLNVWNRVHLTREGNWILSGKEVNLINKFNIYTLDGEYC